MCTRAAAPASAPAPAALRVRSCAGCLFAATSRATAVTSCEQRLGEHPVGRGEQSRRGHGDPERRQARSGSQAEGTYRHALERNQRGGGAQDAEGLEPDHVAREAGRRAPDQREREREERRVLGLRRRAGQSDQAVAVPFGERLRRRHVDPVVVVEADDLRVDDAQRHHRPQRGEDETPAQRGALAHAGGAGAPRPNARARCRAAAPAA